MVKEKNPAEKNSTKKLLKERKVRDLVLELESLRKGGPEKGAIFR